MKIATHAQKFSTPCRTMGARLYQRPDEQTRCHSERSEESPRYGARFFASLRM